ncbi:ATP-dependent helicase [Corynebacterium flavescens]|uniref:DEAD/DEAH box helicase n=1 Tax=Corynebacterium flavescens TaxID=28028 RepID=A0A1L7CKN4_CORFL|nr:ATP-dependent helicase [Corynebacterium flavescens]APT86431.1 DEAD/DEAH box helicase [Corynebacterium flavescens]KAA8723639.1 ATP-dependent helicase [Corynebacterium flavescens]GEB98041.1 DEAD/DEAH box helicase [Corynebacterium flavescens]
MPENILSRFHPQVAGWFQEVFAAPTSVQAAAWEAISRNEHALVVAPTGSGKTLAAFLWALDSLVEREGQTALPVGKAQGTHDGVRILYISPLKALGVDVENNLRAPLAGISRVAERMGLPIPDISVAVRSGDTPAAERARQVRKPPDVLITTPESAYLMLTSKAAGILSTVDTVIVDEIHALAGTKRGVHLALTLERLAAVAGSFQRIGLSATVRPLSAVANFLGGGRPVEIVAPPAQKRWSLQIHVPVEDMSDLPTPEHGSTIGELTVDDRIGITRENLPPVAEDSALPSAKSIWPFIEEELYREVMEHRSTLIFVNARRTAERLTSRLNELYAQEFDPDSLSPETRRDPAQLMKQVDVAGKAPAIIARAHHGSVSKDERAQTETMLKEGTLRAVVATSSLELGIDMGAVELVVQVESPPSVASGLQRVGRAGHSVGAVSHGSFYPKHRADLVQSALTVTRMQEGLIEEMHSPANPLDVLAQQTVAQVAAHADGIDVDEWYDTVRRAWPYRDLAREVFDSVIDLVSGVYPSTDFAELKPRVVYDRVTGLLTPRPGAQRVAVTSGGTIPDRGMFGVFLAGGQGAPRRVGELDEEMVYESRAGDVFTLGATSWRIEEITRDQVIVTPAPSHTGRLPFWNGDQAGRPFELGQALGAYRRDVREDPGLIRDVDKRGRANILAYLNEQYEATGLVPDEKTLLLERFHDELGDWRIVLHSPFGRGVNAAWALAVGARVAERTGMDPQAVAGDDGIVLRLPEGEEEPDASLFIFDADEIADLVSEQVGGSALFASRFRECAARALLLPRRNPGKRAPLWQQRQRAEQLLDVARKYPSFPIILETVRECLQDVYDLPALSTTMRELGHRRIRIAEVTTQQPSPFASTLLFNYTGAFMYEGDSPLAEKRAAALALDPALLAKLLGTVELRELLEPEIIEQVDAQLQRTAPGRRARTTEEVADLFRVLGPIPIDELPAHTDVPLAAIKGLGSRIMFVRIGGREHVAQSHDAPLLRDGLGVPVPPGVAAQQATITDALAQLVARWARTRGPFILRDLAEAFGLSVSAAHTVLGSLDNIVEGRYRQGIEETEYCASEVLRIIRSRSLAAARAATEPVSQAAYGRFLPDWQQVAPSGQRPALRGADGVFAVVEQLAGVRLPASAWESLVLPARVGDYSPPLLDELTLNGEVLIVGAGKAGNADPWIMLLPVDYAAQLIPHHDTHSLSVVQQAVVAVLSRGGGFLFHDLAREVPATPQELREAMWELVEMGIVSPDSFGPVRSHLAASGRRAATAHRAKRRPTRSRLRMGRTSFAQAQQAGPGAGGAVPNDMAGRWALSMAASTEATARSVAHGEAWLDRYGVVTRGSVVAEDVIGGFALAYKVLSGFEESGKALRGYVIDGLGAAQFSTPAVIDRLRGLADSPDVMGWPSGTQEPQTYVLAAADPANPYGAALPWPQRDDSDGQTGKGGPTRAAGALVVLVDGLLIAHLSRGGRSLSTFFDALPGGISHEEAVRFLLVAVTELIAAGRLSPLVIEKANGRPVHESALASLLREAGAGITPKGVRISAQARAPRIPRGGRRVSQAIDDLSFDDPQDPASPDEGRDPGRTEGGGGGFRPRGPAPFRGQRRR